ncbi:LuxR C-terminal-related transcriptional regulator [Nonomuraea sp. NPDC049152]|uniref:helix-turn-helix transcriptional regulator n=1 Tax=Nonomuraea sp. NPDC049152 TaxID=3154350 RepID=UPI0033EB1805
MNWWKGLMRRDIAQWFKQIDLASSWHMLEALYLRRARALLDAEALGFYLYPHDRYPGDERLLASVVGLPPDFAQRYEEHGRAIDPVLATVLDSHQPASSDDVLGRVGWREHPLYRRVSGRFHLEHIATAPILGVEGVIGTINLGRTGVEDTFTTRDRFQLGVVATHISVALARLRPATTGGLGRFGLTPRQAETARLVATGLTNRAVAARLGVTEAAVKQSLKAVFQRMAVTNRVELAALLASSG